MAGEVANGEKKVGSVKLLNTTYVKPKKSIGRKECQLVTFDLPYLAFYYNQKLLLYKGGNDVAEKLRDGLELVLEEFHQLAGKLEKDEDGVFKVVYDDHMEGVEVVEAEAGELEVAELTAEEGFSRFKELLPYNGVLNLEGLQRPLLAVQVRPLHLLCCIYFYYYYQLLLPILNSWVVSECVTVNSNHNLIYDLLHVLVLIWSYFHFSKVL